MSHAEPLEISSASSGGVLRIAVTGEIDIPAEKQFVEQVEASIEATEAERIVLDLTGVEFIDSSGLRMLLRCRRQADARGVLLTLIPGVSAARLIEAAGVRARFAYETAD